MDNYLPLPEGVDLGGKWLMLEGQVNINDLISSRPGAIIRMRQPDALRYIPSPMVSYDHLAGMISDAA